MIKSRLCDLLGIEYPIVQGGMAWVAGGELAGAVSEAGGLGLVTPDGAMPQGSMDILGNFRKQIALARARTKKPLGINVTMMRPQVRDMVELALEEGLKIFSVSQGAPGELTRHIQQHGARVLHVVATVHHAQRAEAAGVDAVIIEGFEAGGHNAFQETPTMPLVPQVVDAVRLPVIAAGGIGDGRGLVAALALGAEGVQVGTRFVATVESAAHPRVKQLMVQANDTGTIVTAHSLLPTRCLRLGPDGFAERLADMEFHGISQDEMLKFIGAGRARIGHLDGDLNEGEAYCGAVVGLVKDIPPAGEVVRRMMQEAEEVIARLGQRLAAPQRR
ncbi:MAG: nitronate monooxygenase [Chloroflexi bacterium]|nr:nitronate monooxygenase [Chloroflexota bacterium]